jgi:hypothetical protein
MAQTKLVNSELKVGVSQLTKQWKELNSAYENFARKKIEFAREIARIWAQAKALDKDSNDDTNQNHFREQLREIIQSENKSILSKWVGIGTRANELLPYANSLPPQRDSLYAVSTAIDKNKPIQRWIDSGKLSTESTVREVLALSTPKKVKKTEAKRQRSVSVTIEFSGNYQRAAELLSQVVSEDDVVSVSSDKAFKSALAQELGRDEFTSVAVKVKY